MSKPFIIAEKSGSILLLRRTFAAKDHPKRSQIRMDLNKDSLTSEYMPSRRYLVRYPALMDDGKPNPAQVFHDASFLDLTSAREFFNSIK